MTSLRRRLLVTLLGAFGVVWLVAVLITYLNVRDQVEQRFDDELARTSQVLWLLFAASDPSGAGPARTEQDAYARRVLQRFGVNHVFQVWYGTELIARSANAPEQRMADGIGLSTGMIDGQPWRFFYRVDALRGLDVIVGNALSERQGVVRSLVLGTVWPLLAGLPAVALLIVLGVQQSLRPLDAVAAAIRRRDADDFTPIAGERVPREITPLTDALNALLERIQATFERERRFTASASHELRTPLAALKTQAQLALKSRTDAEREQALQGVIAGVDRAAHLVEQLLTLARLDPDAASEDLERVDLASLASEVIADLDRLARLRDVEVALDAEPSTMAGRPAALAVLLRNLIDNAIRHSPSGGVVQVTVQPRPGAVELIVTDQGPGIPPEERERVFQRFYRGHSETAGSGLGLSIVARVVEVHHGDIVLEPASPPEAAAAAGRGSGLRVIVRLPTSG
ncbi:MAG TPA: ATP-binding protein [Pseudomonadales bacterium]